MIALTGAAAALLASRLESSPLAEGAGLRIAGTTLDDELVLTCNFTEGPAGADEIVEAGGARIFLDPGIAPHLKNKTISVSYDDKGIALVVLDGSTPDGDSSIG